MGYRTLIFTVRQKMRLFKLAVALAALCTRIVSAQYHPITQELINLITVNNWQELFQGAINVSLASGIMEMQDIKTLTDYYNYVDYLVRWMPTENHNGTMVYNNLCKFYFVLDQAP